MTVRVLTGFAATLLSSGQWTVAMLAALVVVLSGVVALSYFRRKPGPRSFPDTNPPRRLGAPHAGGNHAVVDLGAPHPSSDS